MMRPPVIRASFTAFPGELVIDNFAGGGGASVGIEQAIGRPVDIAINHSPEAIAVHKANHPETRHYCENIWEVDPREACGSRPVGLAWFSPDCTHHSKAKGGKPRDKKLRGLAWAVIRWAKTVRPRVIILENVEEFEDWGPLTADGTPNRARAGETFRAWCRKLASCGYTIEHRRIVAADYGAPTTRRRLFLIARRDGERAAWPEPTHGAGRSEPWRTAAEIIDWSLPCPSIFERRKPLADATLRRIAAGIRRYVVECPQPFIVPVTHPRDARVHGIGEPLRTITAAPRGEFALIAEVRAFLVKYYGGDGHPEAQIQLLADPLHTVTAKARFGLVTVLGQDYVIADIGMRMLQPHELFAAQGFPEDYVTAPEYNGKPLTKTAQVELCGNAVPPPPARALVAANAVRRG